MNRRQSDVRFWHSANMPAAIPNVCFRGNSGHGEMSHASVQPRGLSHSVRFAVRRPCYRI